MPLLLLPWLLCGAARADDNPWADDSPWVDDSPWADDSPLADDNPGADEDEALPEAVDLAEEDQALPPPSLRAWVGPRFGLAVPAAPLHPAILPGLELGLVLPWADERLRPYALATWTGPSATRSGEDPSLAEGWQATLHQQELRLGLGLAVRVLGRRAPVSPELRASGQLWLDRTRTETRSGSTQLSQAVEHRVDPALSLGAGLSGDLGPGQLVGHVDLCLARSSATLTGDAPLRSLDLGLGYRLEL